MKPYFQEGDVVIYHGDSLEILPQLSGIGALVTDPPFSSGGAFRGDRMRSTVEKYVQTGTAEYRPEFAGDNRDQRSFLTWSMLWMNCVRNCSVAGAVAVSFTDWRQLPTLSDALQAAGWTWRNVGTWWKPGIRMQRGAFSMSAEYVLYGTNGPVKTDFDGAVQNVIKCNVVRDKEHIAEKPLEVLKWAMAVVPPAALVVDPFMGSGPTLVAARDSGHPAIGIDVDEKNCEIAARRLSQRHLFAGAEA